MKPELIRDAKRADGWWLLVGGSEQSFVDTADPMHLEFEYVQMISHLIEASFDGDQPLSALHLGGGLGTVPRWLAARYPGSRQRIAEHSAEIADLAGSLGKVPGSTVVVDDAYDVVARARRSSVDLVVCDIYVGPETVTRMFTGDAVGRMSRILRPGGVLVCNLSDATPFALGRVAAAALRAALPSVVLLAEPAVLRGRRSGNLVLAGSDRDLPLSELVRRAAGGAVRSRVVAGDDLTDFIGDVEPAVAESDLPRSGESTGRPLL